MKITQVEGEDFLALGKVSFSLEDRGLLLLQGSNNDDPSANSNGSGKSSLVDLVCWTLFGNTARGLSGDNVIRHEAKQAKGVVEIFDEDADEKWRVSRVRKKNKEALDIYQWDAVKSEWVSRTLGTIKLTQAFLPRVLGCSEEVFKAAIYCPQEALVDLPMLTDKALKELIEEAAGVKILEQAYELARQRLRKVSEDLSMLKLTQENQQEKRRTLVDAHARETDHMKRWETEHERAIRDDEHGWSVLDDQITETENALKILAPRFTELNDGIAKLYAALSGFNAEQAEERRFAAALTSAERARDLKAAELKRVVNDVQTRRAELANIENQVGQPCPECGTEMTADHIEHARDATQGRIKSALATVATTRAAWEALRAAADTAKEALDKHRAAMRDPSTVTAERDKLIAERQEILNTQKELKRLMMEHASISARLDELRAAKNPHEAEILKIQNLISETDIALLDRGEKIAELEKQAKNEELAVEVFSPKGVRAHILDEVTPYLNERTAAYLSTLSDGTITATWSTLQVNAKGEVKERFAIDVEHAHGGKSFPALSGGEKRKVRLACALALQDLVASRATKPFKFWCGDEIDQALDPSGLERLMTVLAEKAKERGTVIVISHMSLSDWISQCWTIVKENGKSELVTV